MKNASASAAQRRAKMEKIKTDSAVKKVREPLFHVSRRDAMPIWQSMLIRIGAILIAFFISAIFIGASSPDGNFGLFFKSMFKGAFGTARDRWVLARDTALLLGVGIALSAAFKMKFWNLGGNGQILVGALATTACMYYLGGEIADALLYPIMIVASVVAGALWALIPAIFKAYFKTNESLFTLMMNYIAAGLIEFFISVWYPRGSGSMSPMKHGNLPQVGNEFLLPIIVVALITGLIFVYFRYSKHGYEISVVGESENTAKYIGINVKKVIMRTLILSGAICGIIGLLLSGSINYGVVSANSADNRGFTAIIVAWLAKFDPFVMILTSFFISFLSRGMSQVRRDFGFTNNALTSVVVAIIYFFVIGCEFFITYKLSVKKSNKEKK